MTNSAESPVDVWPPPGSYPGDRSYIGWTLLGVAWIAIGLTTENTLRLAGVSAFIIVGLMFVATGLAFFSWARWFRFRLWKRVVSELDAGTGLRCVDLGSRDAIATAVVASLLADTTASVIVTSLRTEKLARANMAAIGVEETVEVIPAQLWDLPLGDNCADLVVSDSAEQMVKRRREFSRTVDEIIRIAAPGAKLALVVGGRSRGLRDALKAAGATDVRISRVPTSAWSGYRLVEATIPR